MESIADDVVGGFNAFLSEQQQSGDDAVMTLVQFDSQDPHEVLAEAVPIREVVKLSPQTFQPRAGTPLYDAMGTTIADAAIRFEQREAAREPVEQQNFAADAVGTRAAMASLSSSIAARREKMRSGAAFDKADLFEGEKAAERDPEQRRRGR